MEAFLDIFGIDWRLLGIQTVNFAVLLGVLWYFVYRPVIGIVAKRQREIAQGVADAEAAASERREIERGKDEARAEAAREAEEIVAHGRTRAKEVEAKLVRDAQARSEAALDEARQKSDALIAGARQKSEEEAARLAVLAAEKVLRKELHETV